MPSEPTKNPQYSALYEAIKSNALEKAMAILDDGAKDAEFFTAVKNETNGKKGTLLHIALELERYKIAKELVERRAGNDVRNSDGATPLCLALEKNFADIAQQLIENGASVDVADIYQCSPLHHAIIHGQNAIAIQLIEKGAWLVNSLYWGEDSCLDLAIEYKRTEVEEKLREKIAFNAPIMAVIEPKEEPIKPTEQSKGTSLLAAARAGDLSAVERLIEAGVPIDSAGEDGSTALHLAASYGGREIAAVLLAKGASVDSEKTGGITPLHTAVFYGRVKIIELLLANKAKINARNNDNHNALHVSFIRGKENITKLLTGIPRGLPRSM